jgi:hypothetical protein
LVMAAAIGPLMRPPSRRCSRVSFAAPFCRCSCVMAVDPSVRLGDGGSHPALQ